MSTSAYQKSLRILIPILSVFLIIFPLLFTLYTGLSEIQFITCYIGYSLTIAVLGVYFFIINNNNYIEQRSSDELESSIKRLDYIIHNFDLEYDRKAGEKYFFRSDKIYHTIREQDHNVRSLLKSVNSIEKKLIERFSTADERFGIQTIYIQYSQLDVSFTAEFLSLYNQLYTALYKLHNPNFDGEISPDDILEIISAHTGNSIKFKFKPGWFPSLDSDSNNDLIINIPKSYAPFVLTGLILAGIWKGGVYVYKDVLEVENKLLVNEKLGLEIDALKNKAKYKTSDTVHIHEVVNNIQNITNSNTKIKHIEINQNIGEVKDSTSN
jgi:hypothetical protein